MARTLQTYTTCWKVTRTDATVEGYTSFERDLTVDAQLYRSAAAYSPTGASRSVTMSPDNIDLSGIIDGVYLTESNIRSGLYDGARAEVIIVDWTTSTKVRTLIVGFLGRWKLQDDKYTIELNELKALYGKPVLKVVTAKCRHQLGDTACGFTLTPVTGSVTSQGSPANRAFIDTSRTEADDYFQNGKVTFTSGDNNGLSMDVKKWTNSTKTLELYEPMPFEIATSVTYSLTRGCDKTKDTCKTTFSNLDNFGGFPFLTGVNDLIGKQTG